MALSKKIKSSLLVATIVAGGLYIGAENVSLAKENESLKSEVKDINIKLQKQDTTNKYLDEKIKEKEKELESTKEDLNKTKSDLDKTKTDLNNTKSKLKQTEEKLEAKNNNVSVASASNSLARKNNSVSSGQPIKITMTFYGSNIDGMSDITASGKKCAPGMVASNYYPIGTKFEYNGQIYTVMDRGGSGLNGPNNLDVYVPRKAGESDSQYRARLYKYGRQTVIMNKL